MKEDTRKRISLPPEVYDQFVELKTDEESITELVGRCIEILSEQDQELENEHSIHVVVDIDDYRWMRHALGLPLPAPTERQYLSECIVMLVDERALSVSTHADNMSQVKPSRVIDEGLYPKEGQTRDEMDAEIIGSRTR